MNEILKKYNDILQNADYEVIQTPRLGWIVLRTDYMNYSNPVKQVRSPEELVRYIEMQK